MDKYISHELYDLVKKKNYKKDYFEVMSICDDISYRNVWLGNNLEEYWKKQMKYVDKNVLIEEVKKLVSFVKRFPIKDREYWNSKKKYPSYWWWIHKEIVDFVEDNLEKNIDMFYREMDFKISYLDEFHKIHSHCNSENYYFKKNTLNRIKKPSWGKHWTHIFDLLKFFPDRYKAIEREKAMYKNKRIFWKSKKKNFLFNVKTSWSYFSSDRTDNHSNDYNIIISHIDKEQAKKCMYHCYSKDEWWNLYDWLIKDLWKEEIHRLNSFSITEIEKNNENIGKAIKNKKEKYMSKYFHYGRIFEELQVKKHIT